MPPQQAPTSTLASSGGWNPGTPLPPPPPAPPPPDPDAPKGYHKEWNSDNPFHIIICDHCGMVVWDTATHDIFKAKYP
jgi:hypothetical protein